MGLAGVEGCKELWSLASGVSADRILGLRWSAFFKHPVYFLFSFILSLGIDVYTLFWSGLAGDC